MTQSLEFFATTVRCYIENDSTLIGLCDHDEVPENFVIISRVEEDGEEEHADLPPDIDWTTIQTNLCEQIQIDAISAITLNARFIEIFIAEKKIDKVGAAHIKIDFDAQKKELAMLAQYLHWIFDNTKTILHFDSEH